MQAIVTKFIPATTSKPSRIKAYCERGSITIGYHSAPDTVRENDLNAYVAQKLCEKFAAADLKEYGSPVASNPWMRAFVTGGHPDGSMVHVFID